MAGIKRDKRDAVFSYLVRERAEWKCERCHTQYTPPTSALHCAHIFTRRGKSTRWAPHNAIAACYGCHQYLDSHPEEKESLAKEIFGEEAYDALGVRARKPMKMKPGQEEGVYSNLKSEEVRIKKLRAEGVIGRIEFEDPM